MLSFIKRLFGVSGPKRHVFNGHWCTTQIRFDKPIHTPCGSRVTKVRVCVDIEYQIDESGNIVVRRVWLSSASSIAGSDSPINMSSERTGEAWRAKRISPDRCLYEAVEADLTLEGSHLPNLLRRRAGLP